MTIIHDIIMFLHRKHQRFYTYQYHALCTLQLSIKTWTECVL